VMSVELWAKHVKQLYPDCKIIIDIAQSLGVYEPPFKNADAIFGSTHKWLFGPQGGGLLWTTQAFRTWVGGINWGGEGIDQDKDFAQFSIPGGQNFNLYSGLEAALKLYKKVGGTNIRNRSTQLVNYFKKGMEKIIYSLDGNALLLTPNESSLSSASGQAGLIVTSAAMMVIGFLNYDPYNLYASLNDLGIHIKCIKDRDILGKVYNVLRLGFPYYETKQRLDIVLDKIESVLQKGIQPILQKAI
jgi:UDP-sulfoquinovose synthase